MDGDKRATKVINIENRAFSRDKEKAHDELTDYFVKKNRQIQAAQLVSALKSSLRKKLFSVTEAKKITEYLATKFDIRRPAIQYTEAGFLSLGRSSNSFVGKEKTVQLSKKPPRGKDFFQQLFMRLQSAVQENLLDYNGARVVVREFVDHYPATKDRLRR